VKISKNTVIFDHALYKDDDFSFIYSILDRLLAA